MSHHRHVDIAPVVDSPDELLNRLLNLAGVRWRRYSSRFWFAIRDEATGEIDHGRGLVIEINEKMLKTWNDNGHRGA